MVILRVIQQILPSTAEEMIELCHLRIEHYTYQTHERLQDDFYNVVERMQKAKIIVFATPVYWRAMSGHMKVFFDRLAELITVNKPMGRSLKGKDCYLITCGTDPDLPEGFEVPFRRTCEYFDMNLIQSRYVQIVD